MSTSSAVSIPLIPNGKSYQRTVIFTMELTRGQALSPEFMNASIIAQLVYEHGAHGGTKRDAKATLLVFPEGEEVEKMCTTLQSIEMWLGHSVKF